MDVGPFFKIIRYDTRHCTTKDTDDRLRKTLEIGFSGLKPRGLGMERSKRDEIIALFNWDEDEENELKKLS